MYKGYDSVCIFVYVLPSIRSVHFCAIPYTCCHRSYLLSSHFSPTLFSLMTLHELSFQHHVVDELGNCKLKRGLLTVTCVGVVSRPLTAPEKTGPAFAHGDLKCIGSTREHSS